MAVTAWKPAGTGTNDGGSAGDVGWTNAANITASNDLRASVTLPVGTPTSQTLRATNFGFSTSDIPSGSTIDGIEVGIERQREPSTGNNNIRDLLVRLRSASGLVGDDKANTGTNWPTSEAEAVYGGATDTWTSGLSDSDIRNSGFGVDFRAQRQTGTGTAAVDHIQIRVHYTLSAQQFDQSVTAELTASASQTSGIAKFLSAALSAAADVGTQFIAGATETVRAIITWAALEGSSYVAIGVSAHGDTRKLVGKSAIIGVLVDAFAEAQRAFLVTISAGVDAAVSIPRVIGRSIGAGVNASVSAIKGVLKSIAATGRASVSVVKSATMMASAQVTAAAIVARSAGKNIAASVLSAVSILTESIALYIVNMTANVGAAVNRALAVSAVRSASVVIAASVNKALAQTINAAVKAIASTVQSVAQAVIELTGRVVRVAAEFRSVIVDAVSTLVSAIFASRVVTPAAENRIVIAEMASRAADASGLPRIATVIGDSEMALTWPPKDPDEVLDYQVDWSARLGDDTIDTSTWDVPSGIVEDSNAFAQKVTTIWLSGGLTGATYTLTNRIETAGGRTMDQSIRIKIKSK